MKIDEGLFDHMVLQRNRHDVSEAAFSGTCKGSGVLMATAKKSGRTLRGFAGVEIGSARRGRLSGRLAGLPAGGPYAVDLCLQDAGGATVDRLHVGDLLVGDVWLLGGQSNMAGAGFLVHGLKPHPEVRAFYMNDIWAPARDPIHNMWEGVRPGKSTDTGVGPGVSFGRRMRDLTGVPQGVIACACGGSSMTQWDPKLKKMGSGSLYGAMLRRFRKNGSKVAGLVWYQGCSDTDSDAAGRYTRRMKELIRAVRCDCRDANLPVAVVQIARTVGWPADTAVFWNSIQEQQRLLPARIPRCTMVPAIDLTLHDGIHISGRDQVRLGRRLADAMRALTGGRKGGHQPIALGKVSLEGSAVVVQFENVVGALQSGSRPAGFTVVGPGPGTGVFDVELDRNRAIVRTGQPPEAMSDQSLYYGFGTDPYCNITDGADRSLPVFGPVPLGSPRAVTDFVQTLRVSALQPGAGKLDTLEFPESMDRLGLVQRSFAAFCNCYNEIGARAPEDLVLYYACRLNCPDDMKLAALFGYDGPVKMWVDGKEVFHDPAGTNPAPSDKARIEFGVQRGAHEVLVALGTNNGRAWGIYLRFERLDVPRRILRKGRTCYAMPEICG